MLQFRIIGTKGQTDWLNADEWSIGDVETIVKDYLFLFGENWQLEFR